jgi:Tfp pilus assembly protein PilN
MNQLWKFNQWYDRLTASLLTGTEGLGVCLDRHGLTLAHLQKTLSGVQVVHYGQLPLESGRIEDLATAFQDYVAGWGVAGCPVCLAVSADMGFVRQVVFPRAASENLAQVVAYELDRLLPLSADRLFYDFQVQEETATEVHLLLMALPRNRVEDCLQLVTEAGLRPLAVQLAPVAASNAFAGCGRPMPGSWLLLHLSDGALELLNLQNGVVHSYYSGRNLGKTELSRTILTHIGHISDAGATPQTLCLYGSHKSDFNVGVLQQHNLEIISPNHLVITGFLPETSPDAALPSVGAALTCLGNVLLGINLLPPVERTSVKLGRFSTTAILLVVFLGVFLLWGFSALIHTPVELYRLNRQIAQLTPEATQVKNLLQESQALAGQMESLRKIGQSPDKLKILKDLTQLIPDNTWLSNLRLSKQQLDMSGMSQSASDLIPRLDKSGWLKKTEFASPIVTDANKIEHFKITGEFKGLETGP